MAIDGADVSKFTVPQLTALLSAKNVIRMQVLPRSAASNGTPVAASVSATTFGSSTSSSTSRSISAFGTLLLLKYMKSSTDSSDAFASHTSLQKVAKLR
jgi:hypothetical protein